MTRSGSRSPVRSLIARPFLAVALTVVGVVAGVFAAPLMPVTHTAESRLAVVSATNNAYSIPGYPLAARELASDYSRWVQNNATNGAWAPPGAVSVSASPIPDSAVIRVEVDARSPDEAVAGARQVSETLRSTVAQAQAQHDPERAYQEFTEQAPGVAAARARAQQAETTYSRAVGAGAARSQVEAAATALQKARVELSTLELRQNAAGDLYRRLYADTQGASTLKEIVPAATVGAPERTAGVRFGVLGGAGGLLAALVISVLLERRNHRRSGRAADAATGGTTPSSSTGGLGHGLDDTRRVHHDHVPHRRVEVESRR